MNDALSGGLFIPALALVLVAWFVPKLLSMILLEGVKPLILNAFLSTILLFLISAAFFVILYLRQGIPFSELSKLGLGYNVGLFGRLGLIAGLIWGPVMLLSVAALPRHWTKETW